MSVSRAAVYVLTWAHECVCMTAALMTSNGVPCRQYVFIREPSPRLQRLHAVAYASQS